MRVIQAESAGFCYGVERAVKIAEQTAREKGGCVMLGSIIHNAHVVHELEQSGARCVNSVEEVQPGDTVIIRSHGERKQVLDRLAEIGAQCVNATCPNVLRIQRLVAQADAEGRIPLIIGEEHHPEVIGVASWSERSLIFETPEKLKKWLDSDEKNRCLPLTMVAQTTCIRSLWETSSKILKKECTNAKLFDTICNATQRRQSEAAELAAKVDVMVVVGDRKSANTQHLTEICSKRCPRVYQIEGASELEPNFLKGCSVAGLTAGASTPASIIKEVNKTMSEEIKNTEAMEESFEEMLEKSFKTLNTGEKVTGIVTAIGPTEVQVDLGCKQAGYIAIDELSADPNVKPEDVVKVGDEIDVYVISFDPEKHKISLGYKTAEMNPWNQFMTNYAVGDVVDAKVVKLMTFGAFAEILPGVDGLIHISQIADRRIGKPEDVLSEGQEVKVKITDVDAENKRISLSIRALLEDNAEDAE